MAVDVEIIGRDRNGADLCSVDWCDRIRRSRGLCDGHYGRLSNGKPLDAPFTNTTRTPTDWGAWKTLVRTGYVYRDRWTGSRQTRQMQHRYVMEQFIGRPLMAHENVHHLNGVRDDNRLENLELWSSSQPSGQRVADKAHWAKQILATYEPGALAPNISPADYELKS